MKRITLLALLLLAATSCATTTQAPGDANANANAGASPAATPKAEASPAATAAGDAVIAREKEVWENLRAKNPDGFAAMLADEFVYVAEDGVYGKSATVDGTRQMALTDVSLGDWKVVTLDGDAAVVAYTVTIKGTSGGQPVRETPVRAGSLWVNRGGKWVGVYHQDTTVSESPGGSKESRAAPTPSAKTSTEPVADDAVAREKQVWDAIKKRDFDRFASFLAEDQIEVFGWGVHDKAASVESIKGADLANAVLSDFKTVKVDDDAVVVTYLVKGSGDLPPAGARASTVWVKRDGKWLAAYHQDTTVKPAAARK
jgi:hypothetical protein